MKTFCSKGGIILNQKCGDITKLQQVKLLILCVFSQKRCPFFCFLQSGVTRVPEGDSSHQTTLLLFCPQELNDHVIPPLQEMVQDETFII